MTLAVFRQAVIEICADLGGLYGGAVGDVAAETLRSTMTTLRDGVWQGSYHFWMNATDEDFVTAAATLKERFLEQTSEKIISVNMLKGGRVCRRPSAIWLEGKTYRVRLAKAWGYQDGNDLKWVAELTTFARQALGMPTYRLSPAQMKKIETELASEYLAEKAMVRLFEDAFRTTLD